ncbi:MULTISPECIES: N-acetylmuramoyl-L-alanine amidase [Nostocales]|uniref:N-acetylmuramoyl-L-alanine amidase n=3 Tax=Nostocales TaxID=1161 RepID=A0A0C1NEJ7_9CYAN|nr:N-acetylmuramoyl-L-alanine amidase [Tolypothrix bouteillei]KAF3887789.1 N-acetylmuramoyl-L-alanine amidase [Tolypothrix bouteillei VB521301]
MKINWLLPGAIATSALFVASSPAQAAKLQSWRYDVNQNRLEFRTEGPVQPQAQLVFNPTRLVIDLPGVELGRRQLVQQVNGAIRLIRIGQLDEHTTRLVVELSPGYTLDPKQVKFEGRTPSSWFVQLPTPEAEQGVPSSLNVYSVVKPNPNTVQRQESNANVYSEPIPSTNVAPLARRTIISSRANNSNLADGIAQIENLRVTGDGLFVRTSGSVPKVKMFRSKDKSAINIDISSAALSSDFAMRDVTVNKHGVRHVEFTELRTEPPGVRMTLWVEKDGPDWGTNVNSNGSLVILPNSNGVRVLENNGRGGEDSNSNRYSDNNFRNNDDSNPSRYSDNNPRSYERANDSLSTIESIELGSAGAQLFIKADGTLASIDSNWERSSGFFRITIPNARLATPVQGPNLDASSPILRIRLQQKDSRTVVVYVQPAPGVRIGQLNQLTERVLSVQLQRTRSITSPFSLPPLARPSYPQPMSNGPMTINPNYGTQPQARRRAPNGRVVIVVDPGHGGKDSGAPGLGGLLEKNVVLPISQRVASVLEQNGVQVVLTRNSDYFVELQGRVDIADRSNADLFVSVHSNSIDGRPDVNGLETYYYDSGYDLARVVHNTILESIPSLKNRGVRKARFYVLRKSSMPSILVETGYMTGVEDNPRLGSSEYQNRMADAIAQGILRYLRQR